MVRKDLHDHGVIAGPDATMPHDRDWGRAARWGLNGYMYG